MSIASLGRFTVPVGMDPTSQGILMPKLKFRFRIVFESFGSTSSQSTLVELTKQVKSAKKPTVTFGDIVLDTYNSKVKLIGKPEWGDFTCALRDDAHGNVSKLVGEQIQKQFDFMQQSSAAAGVDYKFVTTLDILDGGNGAYEPAILETWKMYGCFIQAADYGELDYDTNDPQEIALTIKYDNALQTPLSSGVGADLGRKYGSTNSTS